MVPAWRLGYGAYSADNQTTDVFVMLGFGLLGLILERFGYPIAVLVLGYILGPILELNLRRALTFEGGDLTPSSRVLSRPH